MLLDLTAESFDPIVSSNLITTPKNSGDGLRRRALLLGNANYQGRKVVEEADVEPDHGKQFPRAIHVKSQSHPPGVPVTNDNTECVDSLPHVLNDVAAVAKALRPTFEVTAHTNLSRLSMDELVTKFANASRPSTEREELLLVYYGGHGVQSRNGQHYLVPVDQDFLNDDISKDVAKCYSVSQLIQTLNGCMTAKIVIVVLDCCMEDVDGSGSTLHTVVSTASEGHLIIMAASPGQFAADVEGGILTHELLKEIKSKGANVQDLQAAAARVHAVAHSYGYDQRALYHCSITDVNLCLHAPH